MHGLQRFHVTNSARHERRRAFRNQECAMPMLMWFPVIVMAGLYEAMTDDLRRWQRACIGASNRDDV
jgi:hypothetical protein